MVQTTESRSFTSCIDPFSLLNSSQRSLPVPCPCLVSFSQTISSCSFIIYQTATEIPVYEPCYFRGPMNRLQHVSMSQKQHSPKIFGELMHAKFVFHCHTFMTPSHPQVNTVEGSRGCQTLAIAGPLSCA